jgi:hypothetical protein
MRCATAGSKPNVLEYRCLHHHKICGKEASVLDILTKYVVALCPLRSHHVRLTHCEEIEAVPAHMILMTEIKQVAETFDFDTDIMRLRAHKALWIIPCFISLLE